VETLSAAEARRALLWAQGFVGYPARSSTKPNTTLPNTTLQNTTRRGARQLMAQVGAVQLDTISVLARSHELVAYARYGPVGRKAVEQVLWGGETFEYLAHAACVVPLADWPLFSPRRARWREKIDGGSIALSVFREVRARLVDGPATANDLGGAKGGGPWWDWTDTKRAVERLLGAGEVVCMQRRGFQRVYDLAERRIPDALFRTELGEEECHRRLVAKAAAHLGVATVRDITDYYRLRQNEVLPVIADAGLVQVEVEGWSQVAWADPAALEFIGVPAAKAGRHAVTLISPFDSLVWDRARTARVFGVEHRLEAYVPSHKRVHGYYAMPVLAGGRLVGNVDPARRDGAFVAKKVTIASPGAEGQVARALVKAAKWVGAETVVVEQVEPLESASRLKAALGS
jgi:uncharacterized protein YcaQ